MATSDTPSGPHGRARLHRVAGLVAAVLVCVAAFSLVLNDGGSADVRTDSPSSVVADVPAGTGPPDPSEDALVTRMLADLRAGRTPESQDQPLAGAPVRLVRAGPENPAPIAELTIPAIGLRTPVFEGVYEDALVRGPGHWPGTPALGDRGNTVISGHRSTETKPFLYLDRLTEGDLITIRRGDQTFRYAVDSVTIVPERRYVPYVTRQPERPRARQVTLFACNPLTAHYQRIVVRGHALQRGRPS